MIFRNQPNRTRDFFGDRKIQALPRVGRQDFPGPTRLTLLSWTRAIRSPASGRIFDVIKRGALRTDQLKVLCLDEADEMLGHGFP